MNIESKEFWKDAKIGGSSTVSMMFKIREFRFRIMLGIGSVTVYTKDSVSHHLGTLSPTMTQYLQDVYKGQLEEILSPPESEKDYWEILTDDQKLPCLISTNWITRHEVIKRGQRELNEVFGLKNCLILAYDVTKKGYPIQLTGGSYHD